MLNIRSLSGLFVVFAFFSVEAMQPWRGAGVSPFALNPNDGKVYLLIGWDKARGGWNNFGGDRDSSDISIEMNAAREGAEELFLILDSEDEFRRLLPGNKEKAKQSKTYRILFGNLKDKYKHNFTWLAQIPYDQDLPRKFNDRLRKYSSNRSVPSDWKEFSEIAWVSIDDILNAREGEGKDRMVNQLLGKNVDRGLHGKGGFGKFLSFVAPKLRQIKQEFETLSVPTPTPVQQPTTTDALQQSLDALRQSLDALATKLGA